MIIPRRIFFFSSLLLASFAAGAESLGTVHLERRNTGTYYAQVHLRGFGDLALLVDTGSSYSVIGQDVLDSLLAANEATFSRELHGDMADGSRRRVALYRVSELRLSDACVLRDVEVAVLPHKLRAILGMNLLAQLAPYTFHAQPARIEFGACPGASAVVPAAEAGRAQGIDR